MIHSTIIGRLGKDAEVKVHNGKEFVTFSVGVNAGTARDKQSEWYDLAIWGPPVQWLCELKKGELVTCVGRVELREHNGKIYRSLKEASCTPHKSRQEREGGDSAQGGGTTSAGAGKASGGWGGHAGGMDDDLLF